MPGKPRRADELGLIEEIGQDDEGRYWVQLSNGPGSVVWEREGYLNEPSAHQGALRWMQKSYKPPRRPAPPPTKPAPTGRRAQILTMLRTGAEDNLSQALRLRAQADLLEAEAKELAAASDVLEGPELDG